MDILLDMGIKDKKYYFCIRDLIETDIVKSMGKYIQHGSVTTLEHCINVSYDSYKLAKLLRLDYVSVARGALLHDLFLYDWHALPTEKNLFKKHGFTHANVALFNATKYFSLNEVEKDIIEKHMWPLNISKIPKYRESVLVSMIDKCVSSKEVLHPYVHKLNQMI